MISDYIECFTAQINEMVKLGRGTIASVYDISHIRCKDKRCAIPFEIPKHLRVPEEFSKVDVKQMSTLF